MFKNFFGIILILFYYNMLQHFIPFLAYTDKNQGKRGYFYILEFSQN